MNTPDASTIAVITAIVSAVSAVVGAYLKGTYDLRNKHIETDQALKMTDRQVILEELKTLREEVRRERDLRVAAQIESNDFRHKIEVLTAKLSEIELEYETIKVDLAKCLGVKNE